MVKIISDYGYCFGVENAIKTLRKASEEVDHIYLTHSLIHNKIENDKLMKENKASIYNGEILNENDGILFSAHGHGKEEEKTFGNQPKLFDATCPLILNRYKLIQESDKSDITYFFIGKKNHQETLGFLNNFPFLNFINSQEDIKCQIDKIKTTKKLALIPQTTISKEKYEETLHILKGLGDVVFTLPICQLYSRRVVQSLEFLKTVNIKNSICFVLGDKSSSNAKEIKNAIQQAFSDLYVEITLSLDSIDLNILKGKDIYLTSATSCSKEAVLEFKANLENLLENL